MLSPNNQVTTVVDAAVPQMFLPAVPPASHNLYFHIIFKINNKSLSNAERRGLERYITGFVQTKNCHVKAIGATARQLNLLVAMPKSYALTDFAFEARLLSKNFVRRKLNITDFTWHEDYEAFTVSPSQISCIRGNIWRQMQFEA